MADYKTPGVYVLEENSFGSSIVANATAVPMFMGYTQKAVDKKGDDLTLIKDSKVVREPVLIKSALEYAQHFGGADTSGDMLVTGTDGAEAGVITGPFSAEIQKGGKPYTPGLIHPSVANYFGNGGGSCYIVSIGGYDDFLDTDKPADNLDAYKSAIKLAEECTILIPIEMIRYGIDLYYDFAQKLADFGTTGDKKKYFTIADVIPAEPNNPVYDDNDATVYRTKLKGASPSYIGAYFPYLKSLTSYAFDLTKVTLGSTAVDPGVALDTYDNATQELVKTFLSTNYINMPPSPFIAGVYSRLDNATGVWTPPANTSPSGITGPVVKITNDDQEGLNVSTTGVSINAIRSFTGKGTLIWGARTNDGNSLDWRYINVRRLFMAMENDISQSLDAYVFKPNVHNTWVEVKTMIESYLFGLYNDGAFAGTTPEGSYNVSIGVGETMTDEDVLNGYMRVSIQVAPVRPAEFIVLTFSQMIGQ